MIAAMTLLLPSADPDAATLKGWGMETMAAVRRDFLPKPDGFYVDKRGAAQPAFNWGVGVLLSAMAEAAPQNAGWRREAARYAPLVRAYWNDKGPVPGYDVLPGPKDVDRYYDDNAWMVLALSDLAPILKDPSLRTEAERAMTYVLSGESPLGGIYWREVDRGVTRNTCSNSPSSAALLALRGKGGVTDARRIHDWTLKTLQDPDDGLMWDAIDKDGKIEKTKWTYNSALAIRTASELFRIHKRPGDRTQAIRMGRAALARWVAEDGTVADEGKFAHMLVESFWFLKRATGEGEPWSRVPKILARLHDRRDTEGRYPARWDRDGASEELIDQAAVARAYLFAARRL